MPDHLYAARGGSTDSELLFLRLLANGLDDDPARAMATTLDKIGTGPDPVKITCVFTDGQTLYGYRYASRGTAPTLYASGVLDNGGKAFALEPLDGGAWDAVPVNQIHILSSLQTA